jgi:hypothetical protein
MFRRIHVRGTAEPRDLGGKHEGSPQGDDREDQGGGSVSHDRLCHLPAGDARQRELSCTRLHHSETAVVRSIGQTLENAFVQVVKPLKGVIFVDPYAVPGDHTACAAPSQRWTAGVKYVFGVTGFAYHPTALGHRVMAQMIIKALGR